MAIPNANYGGSKKKKSKPTFTGPRESGPAPIPAYVTYPRPNPDRPAHPMPKLTLPHRTRMAVAHENRDLRVIPKPTFNPNQEPRVGSLYAPPKKPVLWAKKFYEDASYRWVRTKFRTY